MSSGSPWVQRHREAISSSRMGDGEQRSQFPEVESRVEGEGEGIGAAESLRMTRALFSMRKTPHSPYKGYFKDSMELMGSGDFDIGELMMYEHDLNEAQLPSHSLANSDEELSLTDGRNTTGTGTGTGLTASEIEYRVLVRRRDFREKLVGRVVRRINAARGARAFHAWKAHVFRYVIVRNQMLKCFRLRNASLCFHAWHAVARREMVLRRILKNYWRKHRLLRFKWWKLLSRWNSLKLGLLRRTFRAFIIHYRTKHHIYHKFASLKKAYSLHRSALVIQRTCMSYRHTKVYWAYKVIKQFVYSKWERHIYKKRREEETARMHDEEIVHRAIVQRAKKYLKDKLDEDEGLELLRKYLAQVEHALKYEAKLKQTVFPSRQEEPELARLFTTRAKAMYVLNKRGELDVLRLSREKFRRNMPPRYYCKSCMSVFLTGAMSRLHKQLGCTHEVGIHLCRSWVLAQDITELALERLLVNFFNKPPKT